MATRKGTGREKASSKQTTRKRTNPVAKKVKRTGARKRGIKAGMPRGSRERVILDIDRPMRAGALMRGAWTSDGGRLAVSSAEDGIFIFEDAGDFFASSILELPAKLPMSDRVYAVAWSPNGKKLAYGGANGTWLWDGDKVRELRSKRTRADLAYSLAWSPDGRTLAAATTRGVQFFNSRGTVQESRGSRHLNRSTLCLAWSPDGRVLAAGDDGLITVSRRGRKTSSFFFGEKLFDVRFSPDGRILAVSLSDGSIRIVDLQTGRTTDVLEAHAGTAKLVSFSHDGRLLASKGNDHRLYIWGTDKWELVANVVAKSNLSGPDLLAFSPSAPVLAFADGGTVVIWDLDVDEITGAPRRTETKSYANAKVVLVGNTSVGKTGLGLVLTGRKFRATESTHARHVWSLAAGTDQADQGKGVAREILLWDLAGQPGYRLIHQLHLNEVAVALVMFDSRSETDPFAGVPYWSRALTQATGDFPLVKFLVASRADRGGPRVSKGRIRTIMKAHGFHGYFETSAKEGDGVAELKEAIYRAIAWKKLPTVTTTQLFQKLKSYVVNQKKRGRAIDSEHELLRRYNRTRAAVKANGEAFSTCLGRLESAGFVKRLAFGNKILLQPELLDAYASWMALAAREQPDGLGFIEEKKALEAKFKMGGRSLKGSKQEKSIILATIKEIVGRGIVTLQPTEKGPMIVFPSELNADLPDYPGGYSLALAFRFRGPVAAIYATLAVSLINSLAFSLRRLYKNAALLVGADGQVCGFAVEYPDRTDDSIGRLTVFFERDTQKAVRLLFLRYVDRQLVDRALDGSVTRERIYHCGLCDETVPQSVVHKRVGAKQNTVICGVCGTHYLIDDLVEQAQMQDEHVDAIEDTAKRERERLERVTVLEERRRGKEFHVFLCHNSKDKPEVRRLANALLEQGVLPWFDDMQIVAGDRFAKKLEGAIDEANVVAVIFGSQGMGRWQDMEYSAALQRSIEERSSGEPSSVRIIPVLLPGVARKPRLPPFLRGMNYVDFRKGGIEDRKAMRRLVEGILARSNF